MPEFAVYLSYGQVDDLISMIYDLFLPHLEDEKPNIKLYETERNRIKTRNLSEIQDLRLDLISGATKCRIWSKICQSIFPFTKA